MAVFRYRLETLLDQKREAKAEAERVLAARRADEEKAQSQLSEMEAATRRAATLKDNARNRPFGDEESMDDILAHRADVEIYSLRLEEAKDAVLSQRIYIEELAELTQAATAAAAEASRECEVLLKHRAKAEARFRAELERKESLEQEEIAAAMFETRRRA
jgi:hypothetical protein